MLSSHSLSLYLYCVCVLRLVVYVVAVVSEASNIIFHFEPSHSTISFILATKPVPSAFSHALGTVVAPASPILSKSNNLIPDVFIAVGS